MSDISADIEEIANRLGHIERVDEDTTMRYKNAVSAGSDLATAVDRFLYGNCSDRECLKQAYGEFREQHAANFTNLAKETVKGNKS